MTAMQRRCCLQTLAVRLKPATHQQRSSSNSSHEDGDGTGPKALQTRHHPQSARTAGNSRLALSGNGGPVHLQPQHVLANSSSIRKEKRLQKSVTVCKHKPQTRTRLWARINVPMANSQNPSSGPSRSPTEIQSPPPLLNSSVALDRLGGIQTPSPSSKATDHCSA